MMDRFTGGTEEGRQGAIAQEPIGRVGRPEEIAGIVLWLCSGAAAFTVVPANAWIGRLMSHSHKYKQSRGPNPIASRPLPCQPSTETQT